MTLEQRVQLALEKARRQFPPEPKVVGMEHALIIEGQNVTLSTEVITFGTRCMGMPGGATQCSPTRGRVGPITIPSVGVEASF